jgi:prepilin-type N-terminal cleavage/methylation domain-containing protein
MFNNQKQKGFTLIEAMVALVILSASLGPMLYLANTAVNSAFIIRDNMIASGLAQEGVEVVRSIRDANWLNGLAFNSGLADGSYRLEWNSTSLLALSSSPPLKLDTGLYNYSSGTVTPFTRTITIYNVNAYQIRVTSQVSWQLRGGATKTIQAESHLFDWK